MSSWIPRAHSLGVCIFILMVPVFGPVGVGGAEIGLTWNDRSRIEEAYHVEREIAGGKGYESLDDLDANSESYRYEDPTLGRELRFRVFATNEFGASGFSNEVSILPVVQITDEDTPLDLRVFTDDLAEREGPLTAELIRDGESLIAGVLVVPADDFRTCRLVFSPGLDLFGETAVEIDLIRDGARLTKSFHLGIRPTEDAPRFMAQPAPVTVIQGTSNLHLLIGVSDVDSAFSGLNLKPAVEATGVLMEFSVTPDPNLEELGISLVLNPNWSGKTTLKLELSDETGSSTEVEVVLTVEPGPRVFFGEFGNDGQFALYVSGDGLATFLGWDPDIENVVFWSNVLMGRDGSFLAGGQEFAGPDLSGRIAGFLVTGRVGQAGSSFAGEMVAVERSDPGMIGPHHGFIEFLAGGVVRSIVGPDGTAFVVLASDSISGGMMVSVDSQGGVQGNWHDLIDFDLQLNAEGRITGQAEYAGLHWPVAAAQNPKARDSRMANLSTRSWAGSGPESIIAGFVVEGLDPIELLIRGIGPRLADFGIRNVLENPRLVLWQGRDAVSSNEDWEVDSDSGRLVDMALLLGGFSLVSGSLDSALYAVLGKDTFTAIVRGDEGRAGIALIELYDATLGGESQIINLSTRLMVKEGGNAILGFVISGSTRVQILIRAVGPGLGKFGLEGFLPDPSLQIFASLAQSPFLENDDWSDFGEALIGPASAAVGAFSLELGSRDAAVVVWLDPGVYSAKTADTNGASGLVLTELYVLP